MAGKSLSPPRNRKDLLLDGEDLQKHEPDPIDRHGQGDDGKDAYGLIWPASLVECRPGSQRQGEPDRHRHGVEDQEERRWNAIGEDLGNGLFLPERVPEIALNNTAEKSYV